MLTLLTKGEFKFNGVNTAKWLAVSVDKITHLTVQLGNEYRLYTLTY